MQLPTNPADLSETDLDAEIAKYTQMLQQVDILELDLQNLDAVR